METRILPAILENLEPMLDFMVNSARASGFDKEFLGKIQLVGEEALVNIIHYAYKDKGGQGDMEVQCGPDGASGMFVIRIVDSGVAFNPFDRPDPDINAPVEEREIGGLGIFLIRQIMDKHEYRRENNRNIMTLEKKLPLRTTNT